ncbi:MAG: universal stress protein [Chloroflexi bacterium]|nr:universal stress protein [Chloroflexota bacterium]
MSEGERERGIRRILVALDASPHSLAALEAAAELAARLEAELLGLFVEDINLLRLAGFPFAREVGSLSATPRPLDSQHIERELRAQADRARRAMARVAGRARVRWSFRVVRGQVASEVLAAASEADLVSLGKAGWSWTVRGEMGSTARWVFSQVRCHALLARQGGRLGAPMVVLYDGSPSAQRALETAASLAHGKEPPVVYILADDQEQMRQLQARASAWLQEREIAARYRWLTSADLPQLARILRSEGVGLLVLPGESSALPGDVLQTLLNEIDCALLVR